MGWYDSCSSDSSSEYSYDPTWYYAVVVGRSTGIYTDHEDAMQQVYGYSGFRMKKFYDYQEVHEYVKDYGGYDSSTEDTDDEEEDEDMWYYAAAVGRCTGIYTDHEDAMDQVHGYSNFRMKKFIDY
ncbi:hypothetical protein PHYBOEH_004585 [Phytophthora boehmeriae]|uniref:Ribonuclease H1 N-terminal domain-containing protein n=1 Tax=Phytophthora boehmeriae TaxID=109152 RepID=A0A8T1WSW2_9STRA|nr:hypothetical protein PHYBOEH_004585 [Phytophthora boehmeriae]